MVVLLQLVIRTSLIYLGCSIQNKAELQLYWCQSYDVGVSNPVSVLFFCHLCHVVQPLPPQQHPTVFSAISALWRCSFFIL